MIKAIIFDFFGVFTADTWLAFCSELDDDECLARARELNRLYDAQLISHHDFVEEVVKATGATKERIAEAQRGGMTINQQLISYIRELKPQYKIAILSNVGGNQIREVLLSKEEQQIFDCFIFSYELGLVKPDPAIFKVACQKLGVIPQECIFIDDIPRNAEAAAKVGMQAIQYEDLKQMKRDLENILTAG